MKTKIIGKMSILSSAITSLLLLGSALVYSQEVVQSEEVVAENVQTEAAAVDSEFSSVDEIVVTGSRLKRSTYSSISPLQIITADISREAGLVNAADILQTSTKNQEGGRDLPKNKKCSGGWSRE